MPLTKLQSFALRVLAAQRGPDSYIAGGIALNREGPRFSRDIDIFQDSEDRLISAAEADGAALEKAGLRLSWGKVQTGKRVARIQRLENQGLENQGLENVGLEETMTLEWVADSDYRFFPAQPDDFFGYVLHPVDLATNKASAAADRRESRDIVDLVTIHETILPLGAVVCSAVGRFPGLSPEEMLAEIVRHSRFTAEEFRLLKTDKPIDIFDLHRRIRRMIEDAESFVGQIRSDDVGVVFLEGGKPVQPVIAEIARYKRLSGSRQSLWPSSSDIGSAMLEQYKTPPAG